MDNLLHNIAQNSPKINITVSAGELKEMVKFCISETRKELEQQIINANTETYHSVKQVTEMLGIHRSTLSRWEEKGYLVPLEIGGRRLYKMSDIQRLLVSKK